MPPPIPMVDPVTGEVVPGTPAPTAVPTGPPSASSNTEFETAGEKKEGPGGRGKEGKRKLFLKSKGKNLSWGGVGSPVPSPSPSPGPGPGSALGVGVEWKKSGGEGEGYSLEAGNDIVGIVLLEIQSVEDLPKLRNSGCLLSSLTQSKNLTNHASTQ